MSARKAAAGSGKFDGTSAAVDSGGDGSSTKSFVLKSDNVFLSGSKVNILGERFFLGGQSQFVSGSNGNIEISSSKFHVQPDGDVVMNQITASDANISGKITADSGEIGGFDIVKQGARSKFISTAAHSQGFSRMILTPSTGCLLYTSPSPRDQRGSRSGS